jgi:hypothetical protein
MLPPPKFLTNISFLAPNKHITLDAGMLLNQHGKPGRTSLS